MCVSFSGYKVCLCTTAISGRPRLQRSRYQQCYHPYIAEILLYYLCFITRLQSLPMHNSNIWETPPSMKWISVMLPPIYSWNIIIFISLPGYKVCLCPAAISRRPNLQWSQYQQCYRPYIAEILLYYVFITRLQSLPTHSSNIWETQPSMEWISVMLPPIYSWNIIIFISLPGHKVCLCTAAISGRPRLQRSRYR